MLTAFIASYGYLAVFLGTILEGETVLIAAGYAAHRGLLDWPLVILVASVGATVGDQLAFLLGRWKGPQLLRRLPMLHRRQPQIEHLLARWHLLLIPALRFLYGLRVAGPIIIGATRFPIARFACLNALGAIVWALVVGGAGYGLGMALSGLLAHARHEEGRIVVAILLIGAAVSLLRRMLAWLRHRRTHTGEH